MNNLNRKYESNYYRWREIPAVRSAEIIIPFILDKYNPSSVVDLGCAEGAWLSIFHKSGVGKIKGFDGPWINQDELLIPKEFFRCAKLEGFEAPQGQRFDIAISLEVAEHLREESAENFVRQLTRLSKRILFSAAIPGQGGLHHVNEQPPSYWKKKFENLGYAQLDILRPHFWEDKNIAWWYSQNIFLYECQSIHQGSREQTFHGRHIVHPRAFQEKQIELDSGNISSRNLVKIIAKRILNILIKKLKAK